MSGEPCVRIQAELCFGMEVDVFFVGRLTVFPFTCVPCFRLYAVVRVVCRLPFLSSTC